METIVCRICDEVIAYVDSEKVCTLYGTCPVCLGSGNEQLAHSSPESQASGF